jgi:hypothetical protein
MIVSKSNKARYSVRSLSLIMSVVGAIFAFIVGVLYSLVQASLVQVVGNFAVLPNDAIHFHASPLFLIAAAMTFSSRKVSIPGSAKLVIIDSQEE